MSGIGRTQNRFTQFSKWASRHAGSPAAFMLAVGIILIWALSGPLFGFGDTWQLVINTGTTIITFLMVFLIQNTQNRDTIAMQIKLDELIRANDRAQHALLDLEELDEQELNTICGKYRQLAERSRRNLDCDRPGELEIAEPTQTALKPAEKSESK